ncbi:MAG: SLBB domain-containing protein [Phycisphaerales bacterium]|nr:MAG: SLBB domain-containing protein [Phycisphaerales bacterium]
MFMFTRGRSFDGGRFLATPAPDSAAQPIRSIDAPATLRVPLAQADEPAAEPRVVTGQTVAANDLLGESPGGAGRVHSPVSGTVSRLARVDTPYQQDVPAIEIAVAGAGASEPSPGERTADAADWPAVGELLDRLGRLGVDLAESAWLWKVRRVDEIIISGLDCDPAQSAHLRTLTSYADEVVSTAAALHDVFGARRTWLVLDSARRRLLSALAEVARGCPVRVHGVVSKYPQGMANLLVRTVAGAEVPCEATPAAVAVWVTDACAMMDVFRAVVQEQACTWQTVTVAGDAVSSPGNYRVAPGSTIGSLVRHAGLAKTPRQIIVGGVMNGIAVPTGDVVLTKRTRCVTVRCDGVRAPSEAMACLRCGECQDVCPVGLDPRGLLELAERNRLELAVRRHPQVCLDCGLCDYVCPSSLPLMRGVRRCREHVSVR